MRGAGLQTIAEAVRGARGVAHKTDIADAVARLGLERGAIRVGDDCAAIPDGEGWLLLAIEGFVSDFVAAEPHFAGYCGMMVNLSDIAAMGGRPIAVVDAIWSDGSARAGQVLDGLRAASQVYGVPVVGGHTNHRSRDGQLAVAVLGRAKRLITSFDAAPGDVLIAAVDLRGGFRAQTPYWDAASGAPASRQRGDLALLPDVAEGGLVTAGKDISMAGLLGTAMMLAECSDVGLRIELDAIPCPGGVDLTRFLLAFPSFGFLLTARPENVGRVLGAFADREIACAAIGQVVPRRQVTIWRDDAEVELWDLARPFIGCGPPRASTAEVR